MKKILITGTFTLVLHKKSVGVSYDAQIYSQSPERPEIIFLAHVQAECKNFAELEEICKARYCEFYGETSNNITSISALVDAGRIAKLADHKKFNELKELAEAIIQPAIGILPDTYEKEIIAYEKYLS